MSRFAFMAAIIDSRLGPDDGSIVALGALSERSNAGGALSPTVPSECDGTDGNELELVLVLPGKTLAARRDESGRLRMSSALFPGEYSNSPGSYLVTI